jgi:hypothetical protein
MSSSDNIIDRLQMPKSAVADMVRAVPDDAVRAIVGDHYKRSAPTPPAEKCCGLVVGKVWAEDRLTKLGEEHHQTN